MFGNSNKNNNPNKKQIKTHFATILPAIKVNYMKNQAASSREFILPDSWPFEKSQVDYVDCREARDYSSPNMLTENYLPINSTKLFPIVPDEKKAEN